MSPLWLPPSTLGLTQTNLTAGDRDGTTVTSGATAHTKGAWVELIASTGEAVSGISVMIGNTVVSGAVAHYLLDIGIGAAGSEQVIIQNLDGSQADLPGVRNRMYFLPVYVPKGSRIAARSQSTTADDPSNVAVIVYEVAQGWGMEVPVLWESLGVNLGTSMGTSVPSGNGVFGATTTIVASTAKDYNWWHVGLDGQSDTTLTLQDYLVELLIEGPGVMVIGRWVFSTTASETITGPWPNVPVFRPIPAGSAIVARIAGATTEARGIKVYAGVARGF